MYCNDATYFSKLILSKKLLKTNSDYSGMNKNESGTDTII